MTHHITGSCSEPCTAGDLQVLTATQPASAALGDSSLGSGERGTHEELPWAMAADVVTAAQRTAEILKLR